MASIFTYDPDPPRVSSPWSTSGSSTPQVNQSSQNSQTGRNGLPVRTRSSSQLNGAPDFLSDYGITKLEPEPQEGPTEYKLHLLLRPRRPYLSMSTGSVVAGSYHSRASIAGPTSSSSSPAPDATPRPMQAKSAQSRQQRLQGLTTQLLWRLQQSSPFHSSTTANLVVPVLPDATPQLGVPSKPARLLPGLEESQGALYEIGVADDGTFVGLTEDELDESVTNLQAMSASLGCKVEILRRVIVGKCEWADDSPAAPPDSNKFHRANLWVAEALVSPDLDYYKLTSSRGRRDNASSSSQVSTAAVGSTEEDSSTTEQIRISIAGSSASGKSSLVGTLTSSIFDNGRGSSRLSLLKHRHEISSGITSSVAQELIGYSGGSTPTVVNYASGNVAAWDDIHAASRGGRLAFVSDLPGSVRYLKSTLRGLLSWAPHYVMLCIPANCGDETSVDTDSLAEPASEIERCLAYLDLCLKLDMNIVIVITKLDVASRGGLRENLAKVLSALKTAGRKPAMLPASPAKDKALNLQQISAADSNDVRKVLAAASDQWPTTVPIVLCSAVDGTGAGKLHALLRYLPIPTRRPQRGSRIERSLGQLGTPSVVFDIDEVFAIPPSKVYSVSADKEGNQSRGMVLCGLVRHGSISVGDEMIVGPILVDTSTDSNGDSAHLLSRSSGPGVSAAFPASLSHGILSSRDSSTQVKWHRIRVISVRNLRLPVRRLKEDQVGTIGIELLASADDEKNSRMSRIRKGMVLANLSPDLKPSRTFPVPRPSTVSLAFHTGFTATFPAAEFSALNSPPLLLGGNAIAYTANVRTTVRVVSMALAGANDDCGLDSRHDSRSSSPTEPEFFSFDGDDKSSPSPSKDKAGRTTRAHGSIQRRPSANDISVMVSGTSGDGASASTAINEDVKITFALITSVEWIELGLQVLVMPGVSMTASTGVVASASPANGGNSSTIGGVTAISVLKGFVGTISEVVLGKPVSG
ncbi:hypothetical protein N7539_000949 [Penicillium diatomitis]|uniref:RecA family profile 2 domain-containing protein n=1 Tax=Penicillium diatomitis TaxID=2819901 RepID=A0A9X0C2N1_9EURO|nr:uncharacterized protein N7539_000949 [Penicillium diatomitis]KAJ5495833.1 hypothetical protein N7539_000949 [Penicillium diatomitis]